MCRLNFLSIPTTGMRTRFAQTTHAWKVVGLTKPNLAMVSWPFPQNKRDPDLYGSLLFPNLADQEQPVVLPQLVQT
jgi:hypothetical protein